MAQCNNFIDYSGIPAGDRYLPFTFTLDTESSVLTPAAGQNQRFCYRVEGVGEDTSLYADLSHFFLAICGGIALSQIENISVVIDGVPIEVVPGENVEIKPEGLKFDFGLDKVDGVMNVCFELPTPYAVGPMGVTVVGANRTASGLALCGPVCGAVVSCPATGYQTLDVCVPVVVTPYANVGAITTTCCGAPTVVSGATGCSSVRQTSCAFTISQRICVAVPVLFGATAVVGEQVVSCNDASAENLCEDCADQ